MIEPRGGDNTHTTPRSPADDSALLGGRLGRTLIASAVCVVLLGLGLHSVKLDLVAWPYGNVTRGDGTMLGAIREQGQIRLVTFYIGLAARDAVGGRVTAFHAPDDLSDLSVIPGSENTIGPYSAYYLEQMSGMGLEPSTHDVTLSAAEVRTLREGRELKEYPQKVVGVIGERGDGSVYLFTDEKREYLYVVPTSVVDEVRP